MLARMVVQWIVDKIAFPSPPSSYSLTSHPELFFIDSPKKGKSTSPGVPCMLYAIPQGAPVLLVHAHSNGCDIGDMRQTLSSISEQLRVHVMSFEFPGYGLHLGTASKRSIDETSNIVLRYILEELKVNPAQVVWYGRSIGSGPAVACAHRITKEMKLTPGGVILQCGYANFKEVARHLFGCVAKSLVSSLWQNEVMIRDLNCPVLLIHGRADKMIPISHSERNFAAVQLKDLSRFHACDCGHNDFNFQRCTLRPIYDFLLGVISAPSFPTTNFFMEIGASRRVFVHQIGPLRSKIAAFSFRRPELEDWLRRIMAKKAPAVENSPMDADFQKPAGAKAGDSKGKRKEAELCEPPPIPDFCEFPSIKDVDEALLDPEGMTRTCAHRVSDFLLALQKKLDQVDSLEAKPIEEIIEVVEAEFWNSDPLLCLWEEVKLPDGDFCRTRLGPFWIDSNGGSGFDRGSGAGRAASPDLLRAPLWVFCPSTAHFRCLAEWCLLQSERLEQNLPAAKKGGSCCCGFHRRRKKDPKKGRRRGKEPAEHPTRGALATSLAAHFSNWVDRNDEIKAVIAKFAELYRNPNAAVGQPVAAVLTAVAEAARNKDRPEDRQWSQPEQHQMSSDTSATEGLGDGFTPHATPQSGPVPLQAFAAAEMPSSMLSQANSAELPEPPSTSSSSRRCVAERPPFFYADIGTPPWSAAASGQQLKPPWPSPMYSACVRMTLRDRSGSPGPLLSEFYSKLWAPHQCTGIDLPGVADLAACNELVAGSPSAPMQTPAARNADWVAANVLLHYARLRQSQSETDTSSSSSSPARQASIDLLHPQLRESGVALNKAMKLFAHTQVRERRELMRQQFRPSKVPLPPDVAPELSEAMSLEERLEEAQNMPKPPTADPNFRRGLLDADPNTGQFANAKDNDEGTTQATIGRPEGDAARPGAPPSSSSAV